MTNSRLSIASWSRISASQRPTFSARSLLLGRRAEDLLVQLVADLGQRVAGPAHVLVGAVQVVLDQVAELLAPWRARSRNLFTPLPVRS